MARLRRLLGWRKADPGLAVRREKADAQAAERLHEMASRLHVLEWEAYGHPKKKPER